jgi:hypothetical protein
MVERKIDRVDACKVFSAQEMLFARHTATLSVQIGRQCADDRVENRNCRHLKPTATLLQ